MRAAVAVFLSAGLTACATVTQAEAHLSSWSNMDLWNCSYQVVHSHPARADGRKFERADLENERRRAQVFSWLVSSEGAQALHDADSESLAAAQNVVWVGPIDEDEIHRRVDHCLIELERRLEVSEG